MKKNHTTNTSFPLILFFFSLFLIFITKSYSTWTNISPPVFQHAQIHCISVKDTQILAGTDKGVFITSDNGITWTCLPKSNNFQTIRHIEHRGDTLIVSAAHTMYISIDNGNQWETIQPPLPKSSIIYSMTYYKNRLFIVCMKMGGVFVSEDLGSTWKEINAGFPQLAFISSIIVHQDTVITSAHGIYHLTDNDIWLSIPQDSIKIDCNLLFSVDTLIFAGLTTKGVYVSKDYGNTWEKRTTGMNVQNIHSFTYDKGILMAGDNKKLFISTDYGQTWVKDQWFIFDDKKLLSIAIRDTTLFVGTDKGMYYRHFNDTLWQIAALGLHKNPSIADILVNNNHVFMTTDEGLLFQSENKGTSWKSIKTPFNSKKVHVVSIYQSTILAGTDSCVFQSTDSGNTWNLLGKIPFENGSPGKERICYLECNDSIITTATYSSHDIDRVLVSHDNGSTWKHIFTDLAMSQIWNLHLNDNLLYIGTGWGAGSGMSKMIYRDTMWCSLGSNFPSSFVSTIATLHDTVFAGGEDGIFLSSNQGETWSSFVQATGLPGVTALTVDNRLFIYGTEKVFLSNDKGKSWKEHSQGLAGKKITRISMNDSYLFLGNDKGIWRSDRSNITPIQFQTTVVQQNTVKSCNGSIYITIPSISIPYSNKVELSIVNLQGKLLYHRLISSHRKDSRQIKINVNNYSPGVYILSIVLQGSRSFYRYTLMK